MPEDMHRYIIEIHSETGSPLGQAAVDVDFVPALEWTRLSGVRSRRLNFGDYDRPASVMPLWHIRLSRPYLQGFRVQLDPDVKEGFFCDFGASYFKGLATRAAALLVEAGKMRLNDRFFYLVTAYPEEAKTGEGIGGRLEIRDIAPDIPVRQSVFTQFMRFAAARECADTELLPIFIPGRVLTEVSLITQQAQEIETGGFLIGHLHHDAASADVFAEVTTQVPATGTVGEQSKLSFTSESWTAVRSALRLRRREEMLLGWWHSHPVKHWNCRECPPEKQKVCQLTRGFLSEQDQALHRAVFSRAWCIAMVVSDVAYGDPKIAVFGWNKGMLEARGFYVLDSPPQGLNEFPGAADVICCADLKGSGDTVSVRPGSLTAGTMNLHPQEE
jgi:hypothetical protein